jgi:geranylgeranyl reductase family protein
VISTADVVIVGAGPAGTAAAITLARAGREVLVVDKARFPREKCCGDGLTAGALRRLEALGLEPATVPSWTTVDEVWIRSPAGAEHCFPLPRGAGQFAAVARRTELDAALVDRARAEGVTVVEGRACVGARTTADGVELRLDGGGTVSARYALGADGAWSPLRRFLGSDQPGYRGEWHAARQYLTDVGPRAASELFVWFEPDILPGYAWSFPVGGGRANVGVGIQRGGPYAVGQLRRLWNELLSRPHIRAALGDDARPEGPLRAWPIPARVEAVPLAVGRVLFIGDAAAATDPMTGEGIGQALATGIWAAEALVFAGPHDAGGARRRYQQEVERGLVPDHRMAEALMHVLRHPSWARAAIATAGFTPWTRRNFARWLFEDYPRAVVVTPRRWRPGLFTGPGAFLGRPEGRDAAEASAA